MIGVWAKDCEEAAVQEFFQLFKTHWEFWRSGVTYDAIVATCAHIPHAPDTHLVVYSSGALAIDETIGVRIESPEPGDWVEFQDSQFPIYGRASVLGPVGEPLAMRSRRAGVIAAQVRDSGRSVVRIGLDLFYEVSFLLEQGQPFENAAIPTLDRHIALLRAVLLSLGVAFIEIAPVPPGYDFLACLTHDVDFVGLRDHKFDRTMWGFLYRCFVGSLVDVIAGRLSWLKCWKNWAAGLSLPLVFVGARTDFWVEFDRYRELEREFGSTFFFIPFRNTAGMLGSVQAPSHRAAKYDLSRVSQDINTLIANGCEIGLHGLDAWNSADRARTERDRIREVTGVSEMGVRMHWLYWRQESPKALEDAGFTFDSTLGYNEAVGFRSGTAQVFRPLSAQRLLELPLNIQDTALFYPNRMNLSEPAALQACRSVIQSVVVNGGVVTINWHTRSLSPERLWGGFYAALLDELKARRAWFGTAMDIVRWFRARRALTIRSVHFDHDRVEVELCTETLSGARFALRAYMPQAAADPYGPAHYVEVESYGQGRASIPHAPVRS